MYAELMRKMCTKCKIEQNINEFYKNSRYTDGRVTWCKTCKLAHAKSNPQIHTTWSKKHPDQVTETKAKYVQNNLTKVRASKARWSKANNKKVLAKTRKYQLAKLKRTPPWLTVAQIKEMEQFYINCPNGYHVDHIIPLQGKNISGLHVPWNLQYLPAKENQKKSNKY